MHTDRPLVLENHSRIHIVGGGPAGSFLAIHLLREARKALKTFEITIIDQGLLSESAPPQKSCRLKGCNFCAGVISPSLYDALIKDDIIIPQNVISETFSHIWIHGQWKNFPLKVPQEQRLCSVFRGILPPGRKKISFGFDNFLLEKAGENGAAFMPGVVESFNFSNTRHPRLVVKSPRGDLSTIESDFVCLCCGVNGTNTIKTSPLFSAFKKLNPEFHPPRVRPALIFEMMPGQEYIKKYLDKELYLIVSGSKKLHLEHIAIVPKGEYLSVALMGKSIDKAVFPNDIQDIIRAFFALAHIKAILPDMTPDTARIACSCTPMMAITPSKSSSIDRISMAGDALGARLYRDGLYSAFISARIIAKAAVNKGVDKNNLQKANETIIQWLRKDNLYCKRMFGIMQKTLKSNILSRILYQTFATEMKFKQIGSWPLGRLLWKIGSGSAEYKNIFRELLDFQVLKSFTIGTFKTFRNILTEYFFGLSWGEYGRYPTVILKDKRKAMKKSIQEPLGITLDDSPQMERMYAIKIRASSEKIFAQLAAFGEKQAKFLQLRFVDVKRTQGLANHVGSVVTYHLKNSPISMDIRLVKSLPGKTLLYEPQELFTTRGVLLFDITPTRDGNHRLIIYTAFDYKQGKRVGSRIFFWLFKHLFPDYAHDVVWNHAVCTIKAEAEKK